jgi:hypothetical protein
VTKRRQYDVSSTCRLLWIFVSRRQEVLQLREIRFTVSRTSQPVQFVDPLVPMSPSSPCDSLRPEYFYVNVVPEYFYVSVVPEYFYVNVVPESYPVQIPISWITFLPNESWYNNGNQIIIN